MSEKYEIRVRGSLGPVLCNAFDGMRSQVVPRQTTIRAELSTQELRDLLRRLNLLGVELLELDSRSDHHRPQSTWNALPDWPAPRADPGPEKGTGAPD